MEAITTIKDQISPGSITKDMLSLNTGDLSGDLISGGVIRKFASQGIQDNSDRKVMILDNNGIRVTSEFSIFDGNGHEIFNINAMSAKINVPLTTTTLIENISSSNPTLELVLDNSNGSGITARDHLNVQSILYKNNAWEISDNIRLNRNTSISMADRLLLNFDTLGPTILTSNLRKVGHLDSLTVRGDMIIAEQLTFSSTSGRLGIGVNEASGIIDVMEQGVNFTIRGEEHSRAKIGTTTHHDLELMTNGDTIIKIDSYGVVSIGNGPSYAKLTITHYNQQEFATAIINSGKGLIIAAGNESKLVVVDRANKHVNFIVDDNKVGIGTPKPEASLHVAGDVIMMGKHMWSSPSMPTEGTSKLGDIVWNSNPGPTQPIGWVCVKSGTPGIWAIFGRIENIQQ